MEFKAFYFSGSRFVVHKNEEKFDEIALNKSTLTY